MQTVEVLKSEQSIETNTYSRILPSGSPITPNALVKTPFAKIDKAVSCCFHPLRLLRKRRQIVAAWTSLAGVAVITPSILGAPHILGEGAREHRPTVPSTVVECSCPSIPHLQVKLNVGDIVAGVH